MCSIEKLFCSGVPCNLSAAAFTIISVATALVLYFLDSGPPLPPFGDSFTSIDCRSVKLHSVNDRNGFLDFRFWTGTSIEYPPEYLTSFITVTVQTGATTMAYPGMKMANITRRPNFLQFSQAHTWEGNSVVTAECLNFASGPLNFTTQQITNFVPGYSRSADPGRDQAKFRDVCLEYEKFLYFVQQAGDRPAVNFDNRELVFEMLAWDLKSYMNDKKVTLTPRTSYLVAPGAGLPWQTILFGLLPLSDSVERHSKPRENPYFVIPNEVLPSLVPLLRLLSPDAPVKLADIMCFETLVITKTHSFRSPDKVNESLDIDVGPIRKKLPVVPTAVQTIVLAENLWNVLNANISKTFPGLKIVRLSGGDQPMEAMKKVRGAFVMIGDHITSLVHMIWMNPYTIVIDLSPPAYACNDWVATLANKCHLQHKSVFREEGRCKCATFDCYPDLPGDQSGIDREAVISLLRRALSKKAN
jgi:hypothetical protein